MLWWLLVLVPKNLLSRLVGHLVVIKWPDPIRLFLLKQFAQAFSLNMEEAEKPLNHYQTIQELFTRRLKPGVRPIAEHIYVHPADANLTQSGMINEGTLMQAKGIYYSLNDLLADNLKSSDYLGGAYLTYYLCPTDYHRVHSPVKGQIFEIDYVSGELWPVNHWSVSNLARLFARNERLIFHYNTEKGAVAVVMVGATNVGQMSTPMVEGLFTNHGKPSAHHHGSWPVKAGDEIGVFNMGSTVVVLLSAQFIRHEQGMLKINGPVLMGKQ